MSARLSRLIVLLSLPALTAPAQAKDQTADIKLILAMTALLVVAWDVLLSRGADT
jgi:hypothetical protein